MEGNTNNTNISKLWMLFVDTASEQNLPTSCPHSVSMHRDDDIKTSEPVAEGTGKIIRITMVI